MRVVVFSAVSILCLTGCLILCVIGNTARIVEGVAEHVVEVCYSWITWLEVTGRGYLKKAEESESCRTTTRSRPTGLS